MYISIMMEVLEKLCALIHKKPMVTKRNIQLILLLGTKLYLEDIRMG